MERIDWRRVQLLGIAGFLVLLPIMLVVIWALGPILGALNQASQDAVLVRRLTLLAAEKPAYQTALARARANISGQAVLFQGSSAELKTARLQNIVQGLITQAGGQVSSAAIDTPQSAHGLQALSVSVVFSLPPGQLAHLLSGIDAQIPYLTVNTLDIRAGGYAGDQGLLTVQMQVGGFGVAP